MAQDPRLVGEMLGPLSGLLPLYPVVLFWPQFGLSKRANKHAGGRVAFSPLEWVERPEGLCLSGPVKDVAFKEDTPDWTASPVWFSIFLHL